MTPRSCAHPDASQPHVVAVAEGMHVVALAGPDVVHGVVSAQPSFRRIEVLRMGQFHIGGVAGKDGHGHSGPFHHGRVVCLCRPVDGAAVGFQQGAEREGLGRLDGAKAGAVRCRGDPALGVHDLDRVHHGKSRHRGQGAARDRIDRRINQGSREEGTCRVMDQNDVRRPAREFLESGAHGGLAGVSAGHRGKQAGRGGGQGLPVPLVIGRIDDHEDVIDTAAGEKRLDCVGDHRSAGQKSILLRRISARAGAAAGGDDEGGD